MSEHALMNAILLAVQAAFPGARLWRQNSGLAFGARGGRVDLAPPGAADLCGVLPGGRHVEIEVKTPDGKQRKAQRSWQVAIEAAGGLYVLARSPEEAVNAVRAAMEER